MAKNLRLVQFEMPPYILFLLLLIFGPFLLEAADSIFHFCGSTGNFTARSTYEKNLNSLLGSFSSSNSFTNGFLNLSSGESPDQVNGIALCRGDMVPSDCRACIADASVEIIRKCPAQKESVIFYEFCLLRYSDNTIYGVSASGNMFYMWNVNNATSISQFNQALRDLMYKLKDQAAAGNSTLKFAVGSEPGPDFRNIYGLTQCSPDLSATQCSDCLEDKIGNIAGCCNGKIGGRVIGPSCYIRFEVGRFYNASEQAAPTPSQVSSPPPPATNTTEPALEVNNSSNTTRIIIIVVVAASISLCIIIIGVFLFCRRKQRKSIQSNVEIEDEIKTAESLQYDFAIISAATDNFSEENKLGQGGFGYVYKGKLDNGKEIAVKRLSRGLGQGEQEFKNEVLLVARLQHRNLVQLIGFCLSGEERLLIYELMPNSSLDRFIFDPVKSRHLDWERRQKIIGGVARGLVYLHEDSLLRIIHRDLKASNVLLDADMTPKIADFGMARLVLMDETHAATSRIVGTYGYMAPEYALYGQFSVKSDVFSFGILVLEIISGQKNNHFQSGETVQDLLSFVRCLCHKMSKFSNNSPLILIFLNFSLAAGMEKLERGDSVEYHGSITRLWAKVGDTEMHSYRTLVCPRKCNKQTNYGFSCDDAQ
ncbi:hypothetical protein SAY86_030533 [Trapa natans]|uniref:Uncharacterized protein n=1 Tax=Trapa natans TaxID=22666 RepID=A0AAN7M559_TRANT|nr:hypothetical protein SAY86_030533 [Trapa natans]